MRDFANLPRTILALKLDRADNFSYFFRHLKEIPQQNSTFRFDFFLIRILYYYISTANKLEKNACQQRRRPRLWLKSISLRL